MLRFDDGAERAYVVAQLVELGSGEIVLRTSVDWLEEFESAQIGNI